MRRLIVIMLLGLMTTLSLPAFAIAGSRESSHATQPYKYIGKELDRTHGLDWYDHGVRHYDPVPGRWNTMDPMCEKYYDVSPYASCGDDPVNAVDPDGNNSIYNSKGGMQAHGRINSYEGTVENYSTSMIVHEWYCHGVYTLGDNHKDAKGRPVPNHSKVYSTVMKDKLFYPKTTKKYQSFVQEQCNFYKKNKQ